MNRGTLTRLVCDSSDHTTRVTYWNILKSGGCLPVAFNVLPVYECNKEDHPRSPLNSDSSTVRNNRTRLAATPNQEKDKRFAVRCVTPRYSGGVSPTSSINIYNKPTVEFIKEKSRDHLTALGSRNAAMKKAGTSTRNIASLIRNQKQRRPKQSKSPWRSTQCHPTS